MQIIREKFWVALTLAVISWPAPTLADISIESGPGRDNAVVEMISLFNRESTADEWIVFDLHFGRILRNREERDQADGIPKAQRRTEIEEFPFYGFNMIVGHTSLNPYIVLHLGGTQFDDIPHRLGTRWNFHLAIEIGAQGPSLGWFAKLHHWSNGAKNTNGNEPNTGEEFTTLGLEWRF